MISDEQIKQVLESTGIEFKHITNKHTNRQVCTTTGIVEFNRISSGIRELIALSQEVKPLDFVRIDTTTKKADTAFGPYFICDYIDEVRMALPEETNYFGRGYKTEEEAIEAANIDNRRRVLGCLVNGGA